MDRVLAHFVTFVGPPTKSGFWRDLWYRTALTGLLVVVGVFGAYELVERTLLAGAGWETLHKLHILRGMSSSFLLASWAFLSIRRARLECDAKLEGDVRALEAAVRERTRDLEEARAFTELLFNSLRERVIVTDPEGRVIKANRVALEAAGRPLLGNRCMDVFTGCARYASCAACKAFEGAAPSVETRADADGRVWELETIAVPNAAGRTHVVVEVGRDVTLRQQLEAQVRHQEKMASLGLLAGGIAHDLGNPLASLSSELELLEGEDDIARMRESLDVLRRHVARISRTLREMVEFARRRRDQVADVSIAAAVDDSARLVRHDPRWRKIELVREIPADLPAIRMVEDHLVMVLVNLMINAADAMPEGGKLTVSARAVDGAVALSVRDTGMGMTEDVLEKAMTPLFTTKGDRRGSGLGLSVCRSVIKEMGGDIRLESAPGKGTRVVIALPQAAARSDHG
jgi:signal transduction histidine kinase